MVLFFGFMILLAISVLFIVATGGFSGASVDFNMPEIPLLDQAVEGWRSAFNDTEAAREGLD